MSKINTFSKIIAGCMSWGVWGKQLSTQDMTTQILSTLQAGITTFDHADIYGDYTTESEFGKAFAISGIERESIQLISKCGIQYVGKSRSNQIKHYNYTKEYIIWSVETSLRNLQTDYLDLLLLHRPSPLMNVDEIAEAYTRLTEEGKIINFGVSNFTPSQIELLKNRVPITANQIEFSLTHHLAMHNSSLDYLYQHSIVPMAWSPLGTLFKENTKATQRVKDLLTVFCSKYQATEDMLLLAWILKHSSKIHPVIGTTSLDRVQNAVKALEIELSLEDWFALLVAYQGHKVP